MNQLIIELKETGQDFEFYPTTDEIIAKLTSDLTKFAEGNERGRHRASFDSVLDIGAGNGKVLRALKAAKWYWYGRKDEPRDIFSEFYAIEKSSILTGQLDPDVFVVGTDLAEQSLVSKRVDVTFCNPPYSEFHEWSQKIIRESASRLVYLVIPVRWKQSPDIQEALKFRGVEAKVIGEFTFENAEDRQARAVVNLIRIELPEEKDDAFDRFFDAEFGEMKRKFDFEKERDQHRAKEDTEARNEKEDARFRQVVVGPNYPDAMVALYNEAMDNIRRNYDAIARLDAELLREIGVTYETVLGSLKAKLSGLRALYWKELTSNLGTVTDRLCSKKRDALMTRLNQSGAVDFTVPNIHAVIVWVLKNANQYLDEQLIETFEQMVEKANVRNYKSNQRAWQYDRWRYEQEKPSHIALEYRMVLNYVGGILHGYSFERGLDESACNFIGDLLTVARNLGFPCTTNDPRLNRTGREAWTSGSKQIFYLSRAGDPLIEVRAFYNGNIHIRLNQKFALALNVEYGRLKGWLKSGQEAADELGDKTAAKFFNSHLQLGTSSLPMLAAASVAA